MLYHTTKDIRNVFVDKFKKKEIVTNKTGSLSGADTIEIVGASFLADEPFIFGKVNEDYVKRELDWYKSQSLNVNDIPGGPPAIWKAVSSPSGLINSNYGYLVYSYENGNQFGNVLHQLIASPSTRRATMIYTRPTIHSEWDKDGMMDFICTNTVQYLIRDDKLDVVCSLRSNDAVYGYKNDLAWQKYVQADLCDKYNSIATTPIQIGKIYWQAASIHVYERHFHLIENYINENI